MNLKEFKERLDKKNPFYEDWYYAFLRFWDTIKDIPRQIKWFIQRGKRGYADCDAWDLDWYLSNWMPQALRQLKKNTSGYPSNISFKEWKKNLELMAKGFEAGQKIQEYDWAQIRRFDYLQNQFNKGMKLFIKYFFSLWD